MATATRYTVSFLRRIRFKSSDRDNYAHFFIPAPVCSWIIALGIKLQPRHRTIPKQLQGEVRKCLDTWLRQGIICPSKSLYASQVVIVRKKTGEIRLCVDYHKLNSIVVRDAFPLP